MNVITVKSKNELIKQCGLIKSPDELDLGHFMTMPDKEFYLITRLPGRSTFTVLPYVINPLTATETKLVQCCPAANRNIRDMADLETALAEFTSRTGDGKQWMNIGASPEDYLGGTATFGYWLHQGVQKVFKHMRKAARPNIIVFDPIGGFNDLQFYRWEA